MKKIKEMFNNAQSLIEDGKDILNGFISDSRESAVKVLEENHPNLYIIENGWVDYLELAQDNKSFNINSKKLFRNCDTEKKSFHGDATVDLILGVDIKDDANDLKEEREEKLKNFKYNVHLINVYENSYLTGEPKVEKQASLRNVEKQAKGGDILLMNMELYRHPYNLPITSDPTSMEIVQRLTSIGVKCIFPAGNSCINIYDKIDSPQSDKNYFIVGAVSENINISNYSSEDGIVYIKLTDNIKKNYGLTQSSAAAATFVRELVSEKPNLPIKSKNFGKGSEVITTKFKDIEFEITDFMFRKWKKELEIQYTENCTKFLARQLSPINRNLFPYPIKLKLDNDEITFSRNLPKKILEDVVNHFKDKYLALKICFGIDSNGNILIITSGYIPKDFDESVEEKKDVKSFFYVSPESYLLNYVIKPKIKDVKGKKWYKKKDIYKEFEITGAKRSYYISEFQRYYNKTQTYGLTIGLNVLGNLLEHHYHGDILRVMIVSDSRNMSSEQEFGVLLTNGDNEKPICIIKDRVLNQADGPSCPPIPPCNQ